MPVQERLFLLCGSVGIQRYSLKRSCLHLGQDMSWTKIYIQTCLCNKCWIRPNSHHTASVQTICALWTGFWRETKLTFVEALLWGRHWARFPLQCISFTVWGSPGIPCHGGGPERWSDLPKATPAGHDGWGCESRSVVHAAEPKLTPQAGVRCVSFPSSTVRSMEKSRCVKANLSCRLWLALYSEMTTS